MPPRGWLIKPDVTERIVRVLAENDYPRLISREKILDLMYPEEEAHVRKNDPRLTELRKNITRTIVKHGYVYHSSSDNNRVFRRILNE